MNIDRRWIDRFGHGFARSLPWIQLATGVLLVALAFHIGRLPFELLRSGARTTGRIVRFEASTSTMSAAPAIRTSSTAFYPVVAFEADGRRVEFRDRFGSASAAGANQTVAVLFMPGAPATAMIDRPIGRWMPWAPTFVIGVFLLVVGLVGTVRRRAAAADPPTR